MLGWLVVLLLGVCAWVGYSASPLAALLRCVFRTVLMRGRRRRGALSGIAFPVSVAQLLDGASGARDLTVMLRHSGALADGVVVASVRDVNVAIRDGVKGDKVIVELSYAREPAGPGRASPEESTPPPRLFVKFGVPSCSAMRLLCDASEVGRCEAEFYSRVAPLGLVAAPRCFFADYAAATGDSIVVTEVVPFGVAPVRPLRHRVRDAPLLEEQRLFAVAGATLHAALWRGSDALAALEARGGPLPRFEATHRPLWLMAQLTARLGLRHTADNTLGGRAVNPAWLGSWAAPEGVRGREGELIRDMPRIMASLCAGARGAALGAYGHNDWTSDNAWLVVGGGGRAAEQNVRLGGAFDWQQACVNNVAQEWAWNWHWLPPAFLDAHERELIDIVLATYAARGRAVDRERFVESYALGCAQMYVWSGGGLQLLLKALHAKGLFEAMQPGDCDPASTASRGGASLDEATREKLVGAEMTRRTFTNCCNIMRRHGFVDKWARWRDEEREAAKLKPKAA